MVSRIATVTVVVALIAVGGSACGSLSGSAGAPTTGRLTLKPCTVHEIPARCGTFIVPENRLKPNGRTIGLRVVVLPAMFKPVANDAVTYITGGPGYAVTDDTAVLANELIDLNEHHDVLLVDQRGTGSDAYYCPNPTKPLSSNAEKRNYVRDCLKAFGGDVNQYGTRTAMDDLDAVRAALGYGSSTSSAAPTAPPPRRSTSSSTRPRSARSHLSLAPRSTSPSSVGGPSTRSVRLTRSRRSATHNPAAERRSRTGSASSASSLRHGMRTRCGPAEV